MALLLLEALGALLLLVLIVWWTMFSGRKNGELPTAQPAPEAVNPVNPDAAALLADMAEKTGKAEPTKARKDG